jgi:hypothetical protein
MYYVLSVFPRGDAMRSENGSEKLGQARLSPRTSAYLYPWDVIGDPEAVARLASAGIGRVVMAAAYHSVRAATPQHPSHRFVVAETAALYRPVRGQIWAGRRLSPQSAPWTGCEDSFDRAVEILTAGGVKLSAWVVLTHNSLLGRRHRELAVRNCFGDIYEWALCPANEEVRDYAALLASEAVRELPMEGISIEACGQLGARHGSHHDKTAAAYGPLAETILSICCCDACGRAWSLQGLERSAVMSALRESVSAATKEPAGVARPEDVLDPKLAAQLLASRQHHVDVLCAQVLDELAAMGGLRVTLHAQADPWATGASPGLTPASAGRVHCVLAPVEPTSPGSSQVIARLRALLPEGVDAAGYLNLLGTDPGGFDEHAKRLANSGADELHLYHFGLANERQLELFFRLASRLS